MLPMGSNQHGEHTSRNAVSVTEGRKAIADKLSHIGDVMTWTILAMRNAAGSPGSGEWQEYLCLRQIRNGFEIAICGYKLDEDGNQGDKLVEDPNFDAVVIAALEKAQLSKACVALGWKTESVPQIADIKLE